MSSVVLKPTLGTDSEFLRPVPWAPLPGKFLLATCMQGQLSNRHLCVHKSLLLAMLLNRTLLVPRRDICSSSKPHWRYDLSRTIDLGHLGRCFMGVGGENRGSTGAGAAAATSSAGEKPGDYSSFKEAIPGVMSLDAYLAAHNSSVLEVDELACGLVPDPSACFRLPKCSKRLNLTPITFPSNISPALLPQGRLADLAARLAISAPNTVTARVLCLGDLFGLHTEEFSQNTAFLPPAFLPTSCGLPLRPPAAVVDAAAWFMQEYLGRDFAALHLRRTDFLQRFFEGKDADYCPLVTIAECVVERISAANRAAAADAGIADDGDGEGDGVGGLASFAGTSYEGRPIRIVLFCTDAGGAQVKALSRLLEYHGIVLIRVNMLDDPALRSSGVDQSVANSPDAAAMVEKVIAANSRLALYARGSSFSGQIRYLRESMGLESCWDGIVCEGRAGGSLSLPEALTKQ
ncbi:hypothetical protein CLOM_g8750 [Closterium sp. NIES-68]|nr:hypothetical protein CLOM_g8750 [Closterium sp. NIES-68]GJP64779.1 hypothetical protein CLOP_g21726 [Closterium sp. NIES-67]